MIPDIRKPVLGPLPTISVPPPPPRFPTTAEMIHNGIRRELEAVPGRIRDAGENVLDFLGAIPGAPPLSGVTGPDHGPVVNRDGSIGIETRHNTWAFGSMFRFCASIYRYLFPK